MFTTKSESNEPRHLKDLLQSRKSLVSWKSLAFLLIVGGSLTYGFLHIKQKREAEMLVKSSRTTGTALVGGPFTLVDHTGRPYTDACMTENGQKFALLYFGFTFCPDICPAELIKMKRIVEKLDTVSDVGPVVLPVFITVDPHRDGVAQIAHYIKDFHPRTVGLTGTPEQINVACKAYRVYHSIADRDLEKEDDYLVDHSIVMYFVGPDGKFIDFFTQLTEVDEAVARIRKYVQEFQIEPKKALQA